MTKLPILLFALACLFCSVHALAQVNHTAKITQIEKQIDEYDSEQQKSQKELKQLESKIEKAEKKLLKIEEEQIRKQARLDKRKAAMGDQPSPEEQEFLANEKQRIALGDLTIKSRTTALSRLKRKAAELGESIDDVDGFIRRAKTRISNLKQQEEEAALAAQRAKTQQMNAELEALKRENEMLKVAMEQEALRTKEAEEEAARLTLVAEQRKAALAAVEKPSTAKKEVAPAAETTKPTTAQADSPVSDGKTIVRTASFQGPRLKTPAKKANIEQGADMTQVVLPGEPPIYLDDDGEEVIIRSRDLKKRVFMRPVQEGVYKADVVLPSGRSYFHIRKRRYRGTFPSSRNDDNYVFIYDLRNPESPQLSVAYKNEADRIMANILQNPIER